MSLIDLLHKNSVPVDHVVLDDGQHSWDLQQLESAARKLVTVLLEQDINCVALLADNTAAWVIADIACMQAGIPIVPLPLYFSAVQIHNVLSLCGVDALLYDGEYTPDSQLVAQSIGPLEKTDSCGLTLLKLDVGKSPRSLPAGTGKITFTSGSTGNPKGVCLANEQQLFLAGKLAETVDIAVPDHLCVLPLPTLLENLAGIYAPLLAGGTVHIRSLQQLGITGSRLTDPRLFLKCLQDVKPDTLILIPQLLELLVLSVEKGWQCPSLSFVAVGGSKVPPELILKARKLGIPAYEGYGLSECASVVSLNTHSADKPGSCGKILAGRDVKIEQDELLVSGNCMLGYAGKPESWYPQWIETGDLGTIDAEGFIFIRGRRKNLLISSYGRNISPEWVESEFLASPAIAEIVVSGDSKPYCTALVLPRPGLTSTDLELVRMKINAGLPDYAQVRCWHVMPSSLGAIEGLLTANGRPCRQEINRYFSKELESLYQQPATVEEIQ